MAWTRSVPTSSLVDSIGYSSIRATMISDPDPTEDIPTNRPPATPTSTVTTGRTRNGLDAGSSSLTPAAILARCCDSLRSVR